MLRWTAYPVVATIGALHVALMCLVMDGSFVAVITLTPIIVALVRTVPAIAGVGVVAAPLYWRGLETGLAIMLLSLAATVAQAAAGTLHPTGRWTRPRAATRLARMCGVWYWVCPRLNCIVHEGMPCLNPLYVWRWRRDSARLERRWQRALLRSKLAA